MKTVKDIWLLKSGDWVMSFNTRPEIMRLLAETSFLEQFPDNIMFQLQHAYQVVDFEVPGNEYYSYEPEPPKLLTYIEGDLS